MLQYEISACSVWWHQDSPDTRYFNSVAEQTSYFETLAGGNYTPLANFNMGDNVETVVIYRDTSGRDAETLISCNYAIVRKTTTDDTGAKSYSYRYFFARFAQDSANQMRAVLSLDDIQTNFFKNFDVIKSTPCWVNRAHLNRFVESGTAGSVTFDATPTSKLFSNDNIKLPKRLIARKRIREGVAFDIDINQSTGAPTRTFQLGTFLEENVSAWLYVFLSSGTYTSKSGSVNVEFYDIKYLSKIDPWYSESSGQQPKIIYSPQYACICAPIYKENAKKLYQNVTVSEQTKKAVASHEAILSFFNKFSQNNAKVYSYCISPVSPWGTAQAGSSDNNSWEEDSNGNVAVGESRIYYYYTDSDGELVGASPQAVFPFSFLGSYEDMGGELPEDYRTFFIVNMCPVTRNGFADIDLENIFTKSSIIGASRDKKWNPQLYGQNARELTITDGVSSGFSYDLQKLNLTEDSIRFRIFAFPSSDISRFYVTMSNMMLSDDNIYIPETTENYTGLIGSFDGTLPFTVDLLDQFLANNKNFYLQKELGYNKQYVDQAFQAASSLFNSTSQGFSSGGPFGALAAGASSVVNSAISFGKTAVDIQYDKINTRLSLDNMRNAKDALQGANGSAILNVPVSPMGFYVEIYEALDTEMAQVDDVQYKFGFAYNRLDTIEPYINTRKYFNYISADFDFINAPLSAFEEERLKARLRDVRFWYSDNVQYTLENYETWLED